MPAILPLFVLKTPPAWEYHARAPSRDIACGFKLCGKRRLENATTNVLFVSHLFSDGFSDAIRLSQREIHRRMSLERTHPFGRTPTSSNCRKAYLSRSNVNQTSIFKHSSLADPRDLRRYRGQRVQIKGIDRTRQDRIGHYIPRYSLV